MARYTEAQTIAARRIQHQGAGDVVGVRRAPGVARRSHPPDDQRPRPRSAPSWSRTGTTFEDFLRKASKDAWQSGALYCGCMAESFGGDTPITGSVTVSLVGARTRTATRCRPTPPHRRASSAYARPSARATRGGRSRPSTSRASASAARTYGIEDISVPGDDRTIRVVLMQTFIPVPGQEGKVALVAGSSQILDLADSFFDIFDAVTSTFRFAD